MAQPIIPFSKPSITAKEHYAVTAVLNSGWLTSGPVVKKFEEEFARYVGARYAVAVNSCTSALFLAIQYAHKECDYIEVPSLTFTASAATIIHAGKKPTFVDVDPLSLVAEDIQAPCVAVDLTGNISGADGPMVVHDCAHRIDKSMCRGKEGIFCFSFYPTKNLASSEGGMICTNDEEAAEWFKLARSHGQTKDNYSRYAVGGAHNWEYSILFPGWKMNMTDIQAAIGLEQLRRLPEMDAKRRSIVERYNEAFDLNRTGLHLYPIEVGNRADFMGKMEERGVGCSVHFLPLHLMPAYKGYKHDPLPVTERLGRQLVSLPLWPDMSDEDVETVINAVKESL